MKAKGLPPHLINAVVDARCPKCGGTIFPCRCRAHTCSLLQQLSRASHSPAANLHAFTPSSHPPSHIAICVECRQEKGWGDKRTRAGIHDIICGMIDFGKLNDRGPDPVGGVEMEE